jgi:spermidine/putrescine transport system ATP-binding protein
VSDTERIVVPRAGVDVGHGADLLVAVRPERIWLRGADAEFEAHASRLTGTIGQVVYLGTLTQFHVDTTLGRRLIVHELSDASLSEAREGDRVTLTWAREDSAILSQGT